MTFRPEPRGFGGRCFVNAAIPVSIFEAAEPAALQANFGIWAKGTTAATERRLPSHFRKD
jgi:hypothetical protein